MKAALRKSSAAFFTLWRARGKSYEIYAFVGFTYRKKSSQFFYVRRSKIYTKPDFKYR